MYSVIVRRKEGRRARREARRLRAVLVCGERVDSSGQRLREERLGSAWEGVSRVRREKWGKEGCLAVWRWVGRVFRSKGLLEPSGRVLEVSGLEGRRYMMIFGMLV